MSEIVINGKIIKLNETQEIGTKGFLKRELVVKTDEKYPQEIKIEFVQDSVKLLNSYSLDEDVQISINIRGSEYKGNHYVNLVGWKIVSKGKKDVQKAIEVQNEVVDDGLPPF